jgi:hypothetical protein
MPDDLFIQYQSADTGGAIVPCSDYWLSPSIWLSGDAVDASTARADAAGSRENLINVRVHSTSPNEKTVQVQVWPCNYLIAAAPGGKLPGVPLSGFTGEIPSVRQGVPGQVEIAGWKPKLSDFDPVPGFPPPPSVGAGLVHICLVANCFTRDIDTGGPDGIEVTSTSSAFLFCMQGLERHHAQKNILVQKVTARAKPMMEMVIGALNPRPDAHDFTVDIADIPGRLSREHLIFLLQGGHVVHARNPRPHVGVLPPDEVGPLNGRFALPETDGTIALRRTPFPLQRLELLAEKHSGPTITVRIPPHRQVPVTIRAVPDHTEEPGMYRVIRVRQRDAKNRSIGGADLILLNVP